MLNSFWIVGSAIFAIESSRTSINCAVAMTSNASTEAQDTSLAAAACGAVVDTYQLLEIAVLPVSLHRVSAKRGNAERGEGHPDCHPHHHEALGERNKSER